MRSTVEVAYFSSGMRYYAYQVRPPPRRGGAADASPWGLHVIAMRLMSD